MYNKKWVFEKGKGKGADLLLLKTKQISEI